MENKVSLFNEISKAGDKEEVMKLILAQLEKDFGEFGLFPDLKDTSMENLQKLIEIVAVEIKKVERKTGNQLQSLFYRIDVSPRLFEKANEMPAESRFEFLAIEVLNRELKKIITRLAYRHFNG